MPHIHLQTTGDQDRIPAVLDSLVSLLASFDTIQSASIKGYYTHRTVWAMGEGAMPGFIHCEIALLSGRSLELRKSIGVAFEDRLKEMFSDVLDAGAAKITVEVREMDTETYRK